jgi:hypothetical protein
LLSNYQNDVVTVVVVVAVEVVVVDTAAFLWINCIHLVAVDDGAANKKMKFVENEEL